MNQKQTIEAVKNADITQDDWIYPIIDQIDNRFVAGYITALVSNLNGNLNESYEDFRSEILDALKYDIWDKK